MSKKIIILIFVSVFIFAVLAFSVDAQFIDLNKDYKYFDAIEFVEKENIVNGYLDNTFKPEREISRGEFTKILIKSLFKQEEIENCEENYFPDVPPKHDFFNFVCIAKKKGIVSGFSDDTFKPEENINIGGAAKIIVNSYNFEINLEENDEMNKFKAYINVLNEKKAIPVSIQRINENLNRAEMAEIIYRLEQNIKNKPTQNYDQLNLRYKVVEVVDGDTIKAYINGKRETIRIIGIDTPETVHPTKPVECFGKEASNKAKELLENQNVFLEIDSSQGNKDKYNRLLRYIWLENGKNFNKKMIEEGFAFEYTYNLPYKYQEEFKKAEIEARNNLRGLWNPKTCQGQTSSTEEPTSTAITTPDPTISETSTVTPEPTVVTTQMPTPNPTVNQSSTNFVCNCAKLCSEMENCKEAYFQLNTCGCTRRDGDSDGIPCESIC